jgi:sugar/nucleoside kinase (ribokinase family)
MRSYLAVVGDLVEDVVVWPTGPVQRGSDTPARVFRSRGGSAANVAAAAARYVPTRFLGCVGEDALGDRLVSELESAGVEVQVQRRGRTGTVVVLVDEDGERTFFPDRGAAADLAPLPPEALEDVRILHVPAYGLHGGRTADSVRSLLEEAARQDVTVTFDASSWAVLRQIPDLDELRHRFSLAFANGPELAELPEMPCPVVEKHGGRATVVVDPDLRRRTFPVEPVDGVRDTTGAGDAFAAGWLSAMMEGLPLEEQVARAHDLARRVLTTPGAELEEHP